MLRLSLDRRSFIQGSRPQRPLFFQQLFGLLAILAAIGLEQPSERSRVPLRAIQLT